MIKVRLAKDRGFADHGWLKTLHTFSFADYYDPQFMGFATLRVINEDRVKPGAGFGSHSHHDMEIISYVLEGALAHKDSMGTGSVIKPGDVQIMSAGTGVQHSEFNSSQNELVHFLQIWIIPESKGLHPRYEQKTFSDDQKKGRLCLVVSPDGQDNSLIINQDAKVYASILEADDSINYSIEPHRKVWIQVARGALLLNNQILNEGDGAAIEEESTITLSGSPNTEFLLFDLK